MNPNIQIRLKPEVVSALLSDEIKSAEVAKFCGTSVFNLRYRWLKDNNKQTTSPALFYAVAKAMKMKESEITEEFHPHKHESTVN